MNRIRKSGILLHITSLPNKYGIGTLGKEAYKFVDFLNDSEQKLWQILPIGHTGYGNSPYQTYSAFAGNPLLISIRKLEEEGLISEINCDDNFNNLRVDFEKVFPCKEKILEEAFKKFDSTSNDFLKFCDSEKYWLNDYSLFMSLKKYYHNKSWIDWDENIRNRKKNAIHFYEEKLADQIAFFKFSQYLFHKQWVELKKYANSKKVEIIGDIPIFVAFDSADAWANTEIFDFDENNNPKNIAGVPPDYFSSTGQLWGNPLYNWQNLETDNFHWWILRIKKMLSLFDIIRIDHFRGFESFWAVPFGSENAIHGKWIKAPGKKLFTEIKKQLGNLPIIAEDLGIITKEVEFLRDEFNFPGMKILQFAFESDLKNAYLPHNYNENCVVYTGTHDNDTTLGWYNKLTPNQKKFADDYLNSNDNICWRMIKLAWNSKANIAIAPLQDFLCLDSNSRMNIPGEAEGNWEWRFLPNSLDDFLAKKIRNLTWDSNR